jgi:hypothetical protein
MPRDQVKLRQIEPLGLNVDARVEIATAAGVSQCAFRNRRTLSRARMALRCSM